MFKQYIPNDRFIFTEKTRTTAAVAVGASSISVKDTTNFAVNDYIMLGYEGEETTEIIKVAAITDKTTLGITGSLATFAHVKNVPVTKMLYNQIKLYGCATKTGTYVVGNTYTIEVDDPLGTYVEYTGSTYLYFKRTYYNATTAVETAQADSLIWEAETSEKQVTDSGKYCTLAGIRKEAGFENNTNISDDRIDLARMRATSLINSHLIRNYTLPLSEVPELIRLICEKLAASYLLQEEYGADSRDTDKNGYKKAEPVMQMLKDLQTKTIILIDADGDPMDSDTNSVRFYPDNDTTPDYIYDIDPDVTEF